MQKVYTFGLYGNMRGAQKSKQQKCATQRPRILSHQMSYTLRTYVHQGPCTASIYGYEFRRVGSLCKLQRLPCETCEGLDEIFWRAMLRDKPECALVLSECLRLLRLGLISNLTIGFVASCPDSDARALPVLWPRGSLRGEPIEFRPDSAPTATICRPIPSYPNHFLRHPTLWLQDPKPALR